MIIFMTYMKKYKKNNLQIVGSPSTVFYDEEFMPGHSDIEFRIPIMDGDDKNELQGCEIKKDTSTSNCYYFALW